MSIGKNSDPTVVDLFCGAGGLSAGFSASGYRVVGGIDSWGPACDSFQANEPHSVVQCGDITQMEGRSTSFWEGLLARDLAPRVV